MSTPPLTDVVTGQTLKALLRRRNPRTPSGEDGTFPLPYGKSMKAVSVALVCLFAACLTFSAVIFRDDLRGLLLTAAVFGGACAASCYMAYDTFVVELRCSKSALIRHRPPFEPVEIPWTRLDSLGYSQPWQWIYFTSASQGTIRVSIYRDGLLSLAECAEEGLRNTPLASQSSVIRRWATLDSSPARD